MTLLAVVLVVATACTDAAREPAARPEAATTSTTIGAHGIWSLMAEPPLTVAPRAPAVWTGEELIIWGGSTAEGKTLATGASYDPDTNAWAELPPSLSKPRQGHVAVWSGDEVLIWGGSFPETNHVYGAGMAYRPSSRTWRNLPESPISGGVKARAVWTGEEMLVWGAIQPGLGGSGSPAAGSETMAYDPTADQWRNVRDAPSGGPGHAIARTGDEVIFLTVTLGQGGEDSVRVLAFDVSTGRWRRATDSTLPGSPLPPSVEAIGSCNSGAAVTSAQVDPWAFVWTGSCAASRGLVYSLGQGGWSPTLDLPRMQNVRAVAGGRVVYLFGDVPTGVDVYVYDPRENVLFRSDHPDVDIASFPDAVWTGSQLLIFNGTRGID